MNPPVSVNSVATGRSVYGSYSPGRISGNGASREVKVRIRNLSKTYGGSLLRRGNYAAQE